MEVELNKSKKVNVSEEPRFVVGMVIFLLVSTLFFGGVITFASAQQERSLEYQIMDTIGAGDQEIEVEYLGTEAGPQLRKFYLANHNGSSYIVRVYQNNRTVLDAFNLQEHPQLMEQFQQNYNF
ncbi:hypothetical protein RYX56_08795 [Alkalihalophilus lindianensis]|uniref:DUF3139 domain-containing protein n=1 Tax=Alkalihalophilus lindianensis TaxID=1630542 RepID=A0ABU3X9A6_9BACI|nr:hypothetical protein [Alkalihalophilus lindianensis]MDV2684466.1 hypothetical protein [Alkalihalophilus lindianensis]